MLLLGSGISAGGIVSMTLGPVKTRGVSVPADSASRQQRDASAQVYFDTVHVPDVPLVSQDGDSVAFSGEVIGNNTVALNFIFTTCTTICPAMGAGFAQLENSLHKRGYRLVSISIDPDVDTPDRLRLWSASLGRDAGWQLYTGKRENVFRLLKALKVYTAVKEQHAPLILLVNGRVKRGCIINGFTDATTLTRLLDQCEALDADKTTGKQ